MEKCKLCGSPATIQFRYIYNGYSTEVFLCQECGKKFQFENNLFNKNDFFSSSVSAGLNGFFNNSTMQKACPKCGARPEEIEDIYKFGCESCYNTFPQLAKDLSYHNGVGEHRGKNLNEVLKSKPKSKIDFLYEELQKAKDEEKFFEAGRIFEEIKKLKGESKND